MTQQIVTDTLPGHYDRFMTMWPYFILFTWHCSTPWSPMFVLNLHVDSWKCSSFHALIVCLSPHQISQVSIILILLHCRKGSQVYFLINLLSTAEYSCFSLYSTTVILSLVGYSFTMFITVSELLTRCIHQAAQLHGCLQITLSHQLTTYRSTTANPRQPNSPDVGSRGWWPKGCMYY